MNKVRLLFVVGIVYASFLACTPQLQITTKQIHLDKDIAADTDLSNFILPYSEEMDIQMNVKIAESKNDLNVARHSSNLMNWMAFAVFSYQTKH